MGKPDNTIPYYPFMIQYVVDYCGQCFRWYTSSVVVLIAQSPHIILYYFLSHCVVDCWSHASGFILADSVEFGRWR